MADESIDELVQIGKLVYASPDVVCAALEKYGDKARAERYMGANESLEKGLLARHDRTIDYALAQNCADEETLKALYNRSGVDPSDDTETVYLRALRVACLSNSSCSGIISRFPANVVGAEEEKRIITSGVDGEGYALFTNPRINSDHLKMLFRGEGVFGEIDEKRRQLLLRYAGRNPRISDDQGSEHGPDLSFWDFQKGVLEMIATVPTTRGWLIAIRDFLESANPFCHGSPDGPEIANILERWKTISDFDETKDNDSYLTPLNYVDEFCCVLAAIFGYYRNKESGHSVVQIGSLDSPNLIERCAYYGNGKLSVKEMDTAFAKDEGVYLLAVLYNQSVLTGKETRYHLEAEQIEGDFIWYYRRQCKHLSEHKKYFDPTPVSEWLNDDLANQAEQELVEIDEEDRKPEWAQEIEDTQVELGKLIAEVGEIANQTKSYVSIIIFAIIIYAISRYF